MPNPTLEREYCAHKVTKELGPISHSLKVSLALFKGPTYVNSLKPNFKRNLNQNN